MHYELCVLMVYEGVGLAVYFLNLSCTSISPHVVTARVVACIPHLVILVILLDPSLQSNSPEWSSPNVAEKQVNWPGSRFCNCSTICICQHLFYCRLCCWLEQHMQGICAMLDPDATASDIPLQPFASLA